MYIYFFKQIRTGARRSLEKKKKNIRQQSKIAKINKQPRRCCGGRVVETERERERRTRDRLSAVAERECSFARFGTAGARKAGHRVTESGSRPVRRYIKTVLCVAANGAYGDVMLYVIERPPLPSRRPPCHPPPLPSPSPQRHLALLPERAGGRSMDHRRATRAPLRQPHPFPPLSTVFSSNRSRQPLPSPSPPRSRRALDRFATSDVVTMTS